MLVPSVESLVVQLVVPLVVHSQIVPLAESSVVPFVVPLVVPLVA